MKWRSQGCGLDPGGWANTLFHAAEVLGSPGTPLTAHQLREEISRGMPSLGRKNLPPKERDKVKAASDAWRELDRWLLEMGVRHPTDILPDDLAVAGESQYQLDPLTDHVCDFAGHVWLVRQTGTDDEYRHTDFMPDFQALRYTIPPVRSLADILQHYIFPLRSEKGVPGMVTVRSKFLETEAEREEWREDRELGDPLRTKTFPIWLSPVQMTGIPLPGGNYGFKPRPPDVHNCLTWATAVLDLKSEHWFDNLLNQSNSEHAGKMRECFRETGRMSDAYEFIFAPTAPSN